jgi:hypothetical protein
MRRIKEFNDNTLFAKDKQAAMQRQQEMKDLEHKMEMHRMEQGLR